MNLDGMSTACRTTNFMITAVVLAACSAPGPPSTTAAAPSPTAAVAPYAARVEGLPEAVRAEMTGVSWRVGCPLSLSRLRLVTVVHWGLDGKVHSGELVVRDDLAPRIVRVFGKLHDGRFPIAAMRRVDAYRGDDHASMAADNTSMFNCRNAEGSRSWSRHAYGEAIDINPVENPYVKGDTILPPAGAAFLDRRNVRPGMVVAGDVVTRAFAAEGFRWGGQFSSLRDYQHFELAQ